MALFYPIPGRFFARNLAMARIELNVARIMISLSYLLVN